MTRNLSLAGILLATILLAAAVLPAAATTVFKSVEVKASPDKVWKMIGPFCAIKDWHPAIGQCTEKDGVRTLVTKDGKGTFVEKETARSPASYTYAIEKSPLPLKSYTSTLKVMPHGEATTVGWSSSFEAQDGQEEAAADAIQGIYKAGLDNIAKLAGK